MTRRLAHVIFRNTAWNYLGMFMSLSVGLILVPVLVRYLGDTGYGLWVLVNAAVGYSGYSGILDASLGTSLVKGVAECRARDAQEEMNEFVSTMFVAYLVIGLLAFVVISGMAMFFDRIFTIPPEYASTARLLVFIVGCGVAVNLCFSTLGGILAAYQRFDIINALGTSNLLLSFALILGVLASGHGLLSLALVQIGLMLVTHAVRLYAVKRINPAIVVSSTLFRRDGIRKMGPYTLFVFIQRSAEQLVYKTDEIVIGLFLPVSAITPYSIGLRLNNAVQRFSGQLAGTLFPVAADLHTIEDRARLTRLAIEGTRTTLALGIPAALSVMMFAKPIIALWVGSGYPAASAVTVILLAATLGAMANWVPVTIVQAVGKVRMPSVLAAIEAVTNLVLSVLLIGRFGIVGVALGTAVPVFISNVVIQLPYACHILGIRTWEFVRGALLPPVLVALPVFGGLYAYAAYAEPGGVIALGGVIGTATVLYWAVFLVCYRPRLDSWRMAWRSG